MASKYAGCAMADKQTHPQIPRVAPMPTGKAGKK